VPAAVPAAVPALPAVLPAAVPADLPGARAPVRAQLTLVPTDELTGLIAKPQLPAKLRTTPPPAPEATTPIREKQPLTSKIAGPPLPAATMPQDSVETDPTPVPAPDLLAGRRLLQKRLPESTKLPEKHLRRTLAPTSPLPGLHLAGTAPFASQTPLEASQQKSSRTRLNAKVKTLKRSFKPSEGLW
jgi:hypothetical protein